VLDHVADAHEAAELAVVPDHRDVADPASTKEGTVNLLVEDREGRGATGPTRQPRPR
jgi:hypothetical protein